MRKISIALALFLMLSITPSFAASKSPTPKPTAKVTAAPKVTSKATATPKATATKAPVKKKPVKKKPIKKKTRKKIKVSPSPSASWPPKGFKVDGDEINKVYAKVPTTRELIGLVSAKPNLALAIKECAEFTCGAVQIASDLSCIWWEITASVVGATSAEDRTLKTFGSIRTTSGKSAPREMRTILMITSEPLGTGHIVDGISIVCHRDPPEETIPSSTYTVEGQ